MEKVLFLSLVIVVLAVWVWGQIFVSHRIVRKELSWQGFAILDFFAFLTIAFFCKMQVLDIQIFILFCVVNLVWPLFYFFWKRKQHTPQIGYWLVFKGVLKQYKNSHIARIEHGKMRQYKIWIWRYYLLFFLIFIISYWILE